MEYLLVKELKSNGFPGSEHWSLDSDERLPDLGMLIRMCGKRFKGLQRKRRDRWTAVGKNAAETEPTPEDAVGALWVSLKHDSRSK